MTQGPIRAMIVLELDWFGDNMIEVIKVEEALDLRAEKRAKYMEGFDSLIDSFVEVFNKQVKYARWDAEGVYVSPGGCLWKNSTERDDYFARIRAAGYYINSNDADSYTVAYFEHPAPVKNTLKELLKGFLRATIFITGYRS